MQRVQNSYYLEQRSSSNANDNNKALGQGHNSQYSHISENDFVVLSSILGVTCAVLIVGCCLVAAKTLSLTRHVTRQVWSFAFTIWSHSLYKIELFLKKLIKIESLSATRCCKNQKPIWQCHIAITYTPHHIAIGNCTYISSQHPIVMTQRRLIFHQYESSRAIQKEKRLK